MTLHFAPLPVALPAGCHGVRLDVADVTPLVAMMPAGDWPGSLSDAADSRRADFLAGRLAAREAVRLVNGVDARIGRADDGSPHWPEGVEGSISHYAGVACAVARAVSGGIGIDVAPLLDGDRLRAVIRRCLTDAERAVQPSDAVVSLAFAAKEALFKAAYFRAHRFIGFTEAEIIGMDGSSLDTSDGVSDTGRTSAGGTWIARVSGPLAEEIDADTVTGTFAWDRSLVYAVVALESPT